MCNLRYFILMVAFILCTLLGRSMAEAELDPSQEKNVSTTSSSPDSKLELSNKDGCICYLIVDPVCASDNKTYTNTCFLQCARRRNPYLLGVCKGECPCCKEPFDNRPLLDNYFPPWMNPAAPPPYNGWGYPAPGVGWPRP